MRNFLSRLIIIGAPTAIAVFTVLHFAKEVRETSLAHMDSATEAKVATVKPSQFENSKAKRTLASLSAGVASIGTPCVAMEYPGGGPGSAKAMSEAEWTIILDQYHASKARLISWLDTHHASMPEVTVAKMHSQIENLKIFRPNLMNEPDLSWRGVGVYEDQDGEPVLKVGPGFLTLIKENPVRAKFEMTRLVAQAWAPCELERAHAGAPWVAALECLGAQENAAACTAGHTSNGGWAISTALAASISPPGCMVPAFQSANPEGCFDPATNRTVASEAK